MALCVLSYVQLEPEAMKKIEVVSDVPIFFPQKG